MRSYRFILSTLPLLAIVASGCFGDVPTDPVELRSLSIRLPLDVIPLGKTVRPSATAEYSDGTTRLVTAEAHWESGSPEILTVLQDAAAPGSVRASAQGTAELRASFGGTTAQVSVTVAPHALELLAIADAPQSPVPSGASIELVAMGTYSDGVVQPVTDGLTWTSSNEAALQPLEQKGRFLAADEGASTVHVASGEVEAEVQVTVGPAVLDHVELSGLEGSLAKGTEVQLTATGILTNGAAEDLTSSATWTSSDPSIAEIVSGRVKALMPGTVQIEARVQEHVARTELQVTPAALVSISVSPPVASLPRGLSLRLTAWGHFTDASVQDLTQSVTWRSSAPQLANVLPAGVPGEFIALAVGNATLEAVSGEVLGSASLTVTPAQLQTITLSPPNPSVPKVGTLQLNAVGVFSDSTTVDVTNDVAWTSSDDTIAAVSPQGLLTANREGVVTITASLQGKAPTLTVTVTHALLTGLAVQGPNAPLPKGVQFELVAAGTYADGTSADVTGQVVWTSGNPSIATVSNATGQRGRLSATGVGTTTVTAALAGQSAGVTVDVSPAILERVEVSPASPSLAKGTQTALAATAVYTDGSKVNVTQQAAWTSADPMIAAVEAGGPNIGRLTAIAEGTTQVSAAWGGKAGQAQTVVTPAQLTSIQLDATNLSLPKGTSHTFVATGLFTDGTSQDVTAQAAWVSSNATAAPVSNAAGTRGEVSALAVGSALITASLQGVSATANVTVTPAVLTTLSVTPPSFSIPRGTTQALTATGVYSDLSSRDVTAEVTWSSSDAAVSITTGGTTPGVAFASAVGTATITASLSGVSATADATVTPAVLTGVELSPITVRIAQGTTRPFTLTGTWSDGTTLDVTTTAIWSSSVSTVATISNASGSEGLATAVAPGVTTISAAYEGRTATTQLTVTGGVLVSIDVLPGNASSPKGTTRQFFAVGFFSDGSSQDLTQQATWSSSALEVATISNSTGSRGLATAANPGSSNITATVNGVTGSTPFTVTAPVLTAISIEPTGATMQVGQILGLVSIGHYSDSTTVDVTGQATWTTSDGAVLSVDAATGTVTAIAPGAATITATLGGRAGSAQITVQAE